MASYQARQRDPLLDQNMQAVLERRGRELIGIVLISIALLFGLMLWTYSPEDPGWMVSTDEPAKNFLGRFGAAVASMLIIIGGKGMWSISVILAAWGIRFTLHRGTDRVLGRIVFAAIVIAMSSVYAASLVPATNWPHSFGLGGLLGDTVLGALIGMVPGTAGFGIKLISLTMGFGALAMMLFVTGFDRREIAVIIRFLLVGSVICYNSILTLLGRGAQGAARVATMMQERRAEQADFHRFDKAPHRESEPAVTTQHDTQTELGQPNQLRADPRYGSSFTEAPHYTPPKGKLGLLARIPSLMRQTLESKSKLIEKEQADFKDSFRPNEDRIKARISDVINSRIRSSNEPVSVVSDAIGRREPSLLRPNRPVTLIADTTSQRVAFEPIDQSVSSLSVSPQEPEHEAADFDDNNIFRAETVKDWSQETDELDGENFPPASPIMPCLDATERQHVVQHEIKKPVALSRKAMAESQPRLRFDDQVPAYELPPLSLLSSPEETTRHTLSNEALEENARMLESVLDDYGVKGEIVSVRPGPVVTMYELEPAPGLKASRVIGLADDIARSMSALSARVSTVPGRTVIGIELPNTIREKVVLREILSARDFGDSHMRLPLALGKDISGEPIVTNLAKMPHLLIAGTTGSGKSVAINTMILSLLYKLSPEECRLIMIDPKMLELSVYDGIPHLLSPVVTDPKKAVVALKWVVGEMEERYRKMSKMGVRNIEGYNGRVREALSKGEMFKRTIQTGFDDDTGEPVFETEEFAPVSLPYIVVIVDEMADLMMVAGKEIEACIQRLAQMARASGIHLIMATQRPSVDVITGTIKANFPTRISFQVTSKIDSRTILGEQGAEQLLGMGDMLYMAGGAKITRIHGPFVSDEEVEEIVNHLKSFGPPIYMSGVVEGIEDDKADEIDLVLGLGTGEGGDDALYDQAVAIVIKDRKCSTSYIQRKLGIGYNKAAKLVEQMEEQHIVTRANHVGKREILVPEA